ncbi:MAG: DUF1080 domain-containing protein [Acidobacteriota bacterium]|jgi:hypothetical protein
MNARLVYCLMVGALILSVACTPTGKPEEQQTAAVDPCEGLNTLTEAEEAQGWELLFDGQTMNGWHGFNGGSTEAWSIDGCALKTAGTEGNYGSDQRVDLATDDEYTDFEISIDWKLTPGANGGLMYGVVEDTKYKAAWETGPEYQFIDGDGWPKPEEITALNRSGADYAMHAPNDLRALKPVGEWNTSKIVVNGPRVEHWLNGRKILEFERWTDDWRELRAGGKWKEYPDYGLAGTGRIVIQDHGSELWFRNIKIREMTD